MDVRNSFFYFVFWMFYNIWMSEILIRDKKLRLKINIRDYMVIVGKNSI